MEIVDVLSKIFSFLLNDFCCGDNLLFYWCENLIYCKPVAPVTSRVRLGGGTSSPSVGPGPTPPTCDEACVVTWRFLAWVRSFRVFDLNAFAEEFMLLESLKCLFSIIMVLVFDKTKASRHFALTNNYINQIERSWFHADISVVQSTMTLKQVL